MSDPSDQPPRLEDQLREIDRRLALIRFGLDPAGRANSGPRHEEQASPRAGPLSEALQRVRELGSAAVAAGSPSTAEPGRPASTADPRVPRPEPTERLEALRALQAALAELEARVAEALSACREALARALQPAAGAERAIGPAAGAEPPERGLRAATVVAGPFRAIGEVRAFELALGELAPVEEVRLAGYEGEDRAVLEVRLRDPRAPDRDPRAPDRDPRAPDRLAPYP
jgi:hypothetical protein